LRESIVTIALKASTNQYFKRFFGTRSAICYVPKFKSFLLLLLR
jgi:hypothetical protein